MATDNFTINDLGSLSQAFSQVIAKYLLSARQQLILNCLKDIMLGKMALTDFVDLLQTEVNLDFISAGKVAYELKKNILDKTAEIAGIKQHWQKKSAESFNPQVLIDEVLDKAGLKFTDQQLKIRFDKAVLNWLKDASDEQELKDIITKSQKVGGIGLAEEEFNMLYALLVKKKEQAKTKNMDLTKVNIDFETIPAEFKAKLPRTENINIEISLENVLNAVKSEAGLKISQDLDKRLNDVILSWYRDIRDDAEALDILTRSVKIGGVGLTLEAGQNLIKVLKAKEIELENEDIDILKLISQELAKEIKMNVPAQVTEQDIDVGARVSERSVLAPKTETDISQLLHEKNVSFQELEQKEKIKRDLGDKERISEVRGNLAKEIMAKEEYLEDTKEIEPPAQNNYQPVQPVMRPEMPVSSELKTGFKQPMVKNTASEIRPTMDDVKFSPQLYGPIDELAVFKIEDLRRLSRDPLVAAQKIKTKIELLEDESILQRNEGLKALKSSPLYKAYAEIMNTAIKEGKSFDQVIAAKPIMTLAEFKAVMDLNKSLKY